MAPVSFYTNKFFGTVPRLPVPRLPLGGSLGNPKILGTGATLHLGPTRLTRRKLGVPCLKIVSLQNGRVSGASAIHERVHEA